MKKTIFFVVITLLLGFAGQVKAQNCDEIVKAYYGYRQGILDVVYPGCSKYNFICHQSQVAFEYADRAPEGAVVLDITSLVDLRTGNNVPATYAAEASSLNYYAFNYRDVQNHYPFDVVLYFQLHAGEHQYLVLRSLNQIVHSMDEFMAQEGSSANNR